MKLLRVVMTMVILIITSSHASAEGRIFKRIPPVGNTGADGFTTYDITRTTDGFIWLATDHGLMRFDGEYSVRVDIPGLNSGNVVVKALAPTDDGAIIAAAGNKVFRIIPGNGRHVVKPLLDGKPFPTTCALQVAGKFSLIGGDEGIVVFTPDGKERRIMVGRDVLDLSNKVVDMTYSGKGIFLLTKGGVFRLDPEKLTVERVGNVSAADEPEGTAIAASDKYIYIGTSGKGLWRLDPESGVMKEAFDFSRGKVVTSLKMSQDGNTLFVGTDGGGVTKIAIPSERIICHSRHMASDPNSQASNQVYSLFADRDGHLWIGYYQNGADYTPSWTGPFELLDDPAVYNTRGVSVRALSIADGRITIGTREGLVVFERNCSTAVTVGSPVLRSEMVISLLDHKGITYIGTYGGGLQIFDPVSRRVTDLPWNTQNPVFKSGHIFAIAADKDDNIWIGTNQGLFRKSPSGNLTQYTSSDSALPDGNVYGIFFDSEGKGWICTDTGLCVYDPRQDKLRTDLFPAIFPHNTRFRTVYEDHAHRLYFVPESGMVISSNLDLSDQQTYTNPLLDKADAKGVVEDREGNIWIATNAGIFRVDSHDHAIRFGLAAGLPSASFLQSQPAHDSEGHIWFGNSAGLVRLTESDIDSSINSQRVPVPTILTLNGTPVDFTPTPEASDGSYRINLDKTTNTVKIGFSTLSYALEEPESYLYSLDGKNWEPFAGEISITLYELTPGRHELRVKSANDSENEPEITVVHIHVPVPVWWYVVGGLVLALLAVGIAVGIHVSRRRKREASAAQALAATSDEDNVAAATTEETSQRQKKYASNNLTRTEAREIAKRVQEVMDNEKPYLNADLKVGDLAEAVGISSHKLSQFFSQHKGQTFYDYINRHRVDEFKQLVKDEKNRSLTLSAMAEKAGFSSRASFFRHFKNIEGISPGEYLKGLDKE